MRTRLGSELVNQDRRQLLTTTVMGIAAAVAAGTVLATSALAQSAREIRSPLPYVAIENEPAPKLIVVAQSATSADQIEHHIAKIDGTRFHYVTAGTGDPVLLIPGWPESWIAWRKVLPLLVGAGRRVVVLDPRGFGESDKPAGGYDLDTAARDLHRFLEATNLATAGGIDIIAHEVGTWIAHAHAVNYPADVRRLVLTEAAERSTGDTGPPAARDVRGPTRSEVGADASGEPLMIVDLPLGPRLRWRSPHGPSVPIATSFISTRSIRAATSRRGNILSFLSAEL
jgi:pimeloyl-ACP methyl ester carboxylesterase